MTHKVFWDDPYQVELESTVSRVDGPCIELEETVFYAESGGQGKRCRYHWWYPSDKGREARSIHCLYTGT